MGKKLYVGNISFKTTREELKELFEKAGEVETATIITDFHTGRSKGFGFVEMTNEEDARKAIEAINGTIFMEKTLSVAEAKPQQPRENKSGFGARRGGFGGGPGGRGPGRGRR
ncbi:MAG: RNA-binding protein [Dissulfurispiraceae bacterium]